MPIRVCADVADHLYAGRVEPDGQEIVLHGWLIGASQESCILGSFACLVPAGAQTAGNLSADLGANCRQARSICRQARVQSCCARSLARCVTHLRGAIKLVFTALYMQS